ncbi:MAG TPA: hypothetical protein PK100_04990, partial [Candidatus Saccharicenans sp.]|nr:hypothetical protein [Candidatus Saccharicenans sp.]
MKNNFKSGRVKSRVERMMVGCGLFLVGLFFLNSLIVAGAENSREERGLVSSRSDLNLPVTSQASAESSSLPRPEYPRPDFTRSRWLNLNGEWDFAFDLSDSGEERGLPQGEGFDRKILVPFAPESKLS